MNYLFDQISPHFIEGAESCAGGMQGYHNPFSSDTQEAMDWDRGFMTTLEQAFVHNLLQKAGLV